MTHERSDRRASTEARLALALALLSALLGASSLVVAPLNGASLLEFINGPAQSATLAVAFSVLGASILGHRSQPRIGWICCLIGVTDALLAASDQYARYALATKPGLPGGALGSVAAAPAAPVDWFQAQVRQRRDHLGAQQCVAQLEQGVGAAGEAGVQLAPERAELREGES